MAEHKKTAGAKAPAKRKSVAKAADAAETVTSKAPARAKKTPVEAKKAAATQVSKAGKSRAAGAAGRSSAAPKERSRGPAKAETALLFDLPVATASTAAVMASLPNAKPARKVSEPSRELQAGGSATAPSGMLGHAVAETATAATTTVLEVNAKVLDAVRAQSDAAFELWRSTLAAGSLSEAMRVQTSGARQAYETAANHWKDMAETTTRWFASAMKPLHSTDRRR